MSNIHPHVRREVEALRAQVNAIVHTPGKTSFTPIFKRFDALCIDPDFHEASVPDDFAPLQEPICALLRSVMGVRAAVLMVLGSARIPELGLRHGAFTFQGQPGAYFIFDGDQRGMLGFLRPDGQAAMMRFTLSPTEPGELPDRLSRGPGGVH